MLYRSPALAAALLSAPRALANLEQPGLVVCNDVCACRVRASSKLGLLSDMVLVLLLILVGRG